MENHPKGLIPIVLVIFIAIIAGGVVGAAWYYDQHKDEIVTTKNTDTTNTNAVSNQNTNTSEIDTSDWQTYTNPDYNYSFKFPNDYSVNDQTIDHVSVSKSEPPNGYGITIFKYTGLNKSAFIKDELEWFGQALKDSFDVKYFTNRRSTSIGRKSFTTFDVDSNNKTNILHHYYVENDNAWLIVESRSVTDTTVNAVNDTMLSSFRILGDTDWQTYTNEEYGFSLKYPSDWEIVNNSNEWGRIAGLRDSKTNVTADSSWSLISISYEDNPDDLSVCDYYKLQSEQSTDFAIPDYCSDLDYTEVTIGNLPAMQFPSVPGVIGIKLTSVNKDEKIFSISMILDNNRNDGVYNNVLKSFQFLK